MAKRRKSGRRIVLWSAVVLAALLAFAGVVLAILARRAEPFLRARIVEALEDRFHARVELDSFHISLKDGLEAEGRGLRIWPPAQVEGIAVPGPAQTAPPRPSAGKRGTAPPVAPAAVVSIPRLPLIRLEEFRFRAPLRYQPGKPFHIALVQLKGLDIHVPPRSHFTHPAQTTATAKAPLLAFAVDAIECSTASLTLETDKPGKQPLDFAIRTLHLTHLAADGAVHYEADLTNPRPTGRLHVSGSFGPWRADDPGESSLSGDYRFEQAHLGDFHEIAGTLDSTGHFQGTVRDVEVQGETRTPDFRLTHFSNALALTTRFQAAVDATNGDTRLEAVDAVLGSSHFTAKGTILRVPAPDGSARSMGHDIALAVRVDRARIEDFLLLTGHTADPMLTGPLVLNATVHIPPGPPPMEKRMELNGRFLLEQARFTHAATQSRIAELSLRGQGHPELIRSTPPASIGTRMEGDFHMTGGVLRLPPGTLRARRESSSPSRSSRCAANASSRRGTGQVDGTDPRARGLPIGRAGRSRRPASPPLWSMRSGWPTRTGSGSL